MYHCLLKLREDLSGIHGTTPDGSKENNNLGGSGSYGGNNRGGHSGGRKKIPEEIKLNEPPTYIKFLWEQDVINFYNTRDYIFQSELMLIILTMII